jgi:hypothetical protein
VQSEKKILWQASNSGVCKEIATTDRNTYCKEIENILGKNGDS